MSNYVEVDEDDIDLEVRRGEAVRERIPTFTTRAFTPSRADIPEPVRFNDHVYDRVSYLNPSHRRSRSEARVNIPREGYQYVERDIYEWREPNRTSNRTRSRIERDIRDSSNQQRENSPIAHHIERDVNRDRTTQTQNINMTREHSRGLFQTVYDIAHARDVTVHFSFPLFQDYGIELESLSRLWRLGNFTDAKDFIKHNVSHLNHPVIFVQYSEALLDMGDYKSFELLDSKAVFGETFDPRPKAWKDKQRDEEIVRLRSQGSQSWRRKRSSSVAGTRGPVMHGGERADISRSPPPRRRSNETGIPTRDKTPEFQTKGNAELWSDETYLLQVIWRLLNATFIMHRNNTMKEALDEAQFVLDNLVIGPEFSSAVIKIMTLTLRIFGDYRTSFPDLFSTRIKISLDRWTSWSELYHTLLSQGRVWDFRDIFLAAIPCFGLNQTCQKFLGTGSYREKILHHWILYERDESTTLALLDVLMTAVFELGSSNNALSEWQWLRKDAQELVEEIMETYPESIKSRPFMKFILAQAADLSISQDYGLDNNAFQENFDYLEDYPGFVLQLPARTSLPVYVPRRLETPIWSAAEVPEESNIPIQMALDLATELKDYYTQALCLKLLIRRSPDPTSLFEQLLHLQKTTQGDRAEHLQTCLSSFIVCKEKVSQKNLLLELRDHDDWNEFRVRDPQLCFAKEFIERALTAKVDERSVLPPFRRPRMDYYPWLPKRAQMFIQSLSVDLDFVSRPPPESHPRPRDSDNDDIYVRPDVSAKRRVIVEQELDSGSSSNSRSPSNSRPSSQCSSDNGSDLGDCKVIFPHGNRVRISKDELEGKRVMVSVQSPKGKKEYTSASWMMEGDWVSITTKKRVKERRGGVETNARRRAQKRPVTVRAGASDARDVRVPRNQDEERLSRSENPHLGNLTSDVVLHSDQHNERRRTTRNQLDDDGIRIIPDDPRATYDESSHDEGIRVIPDNPNVA